MKIIQLLCLRQHAYTSISTSTSTSTSTNIPNKKTILTTHLIIITQPIHYLTSSLPFQSSLSLFFAFQLASLPRRSSFLFSHALVSFSALAIFFSPFWWGESGDYEPEQPSEEERDYRSITVYSTLGNISPSQHHLPPHCIYPLATADTYRYRCRCN
jgi:hypothetical protein